MADLIASPRPESSADAIRRADPEPSSTKTRGSASVTPRSPNSPGGLAHEIRNPLSTMSLNLDLLAEEFQNPETNRERRVIQKIERLRRESQRLQDILENFLRFARVQELRLETADLNVVVEELRDFFEPQAMTQGIVIRTQYEPDLPRMSLEVDLFRQALLNLFINARQAMPDGGELLLRTRSEGRLERPGSHRHGGRDARGRPGAGLRRLLLDPPRRQRPGPADDPQDRRGPRRHDPGPERAGQGVAVHPPAAQPSGRPRPARRGDQARTIRPMDQQIRVLVVDDDEPHAEAVAESLERVGYECVVATSGRDGLRIIEEQTFDIVLTDLIMDGVGGLEILAKAKRELPDAEVVILTGHGTIKTAVTAMQAGATTYLTKPLDINELRTVVDKASQSQRLARSNVELQRQLNERFGFEGVIGSSVVMHAVVARLRQIAPTTATVLITGESGTGKELVAKALHNNSPRRYKPFVAAELRGPEREHPRKRAVRPHQGGVHRRRPRAQGLVRIRQRRHPLPRRGRRHPALDAGQAAPGAGVGRDRPGRHQRAAQGQRPPDLGDQPRPERRDRRGDVPPGPVPPAQGRQRQAPAAPLASGRHPAADRLLPQGVHRGARQDRHLDHPGDAQGADGVPLAGERPRAEERDREHGRDRLRRRARPRRPDRGHPGRRPRAARSAGSGASAHLVGHSLEEIEKYYIAETLKQTAGNREEAAKLLGIGERTLYRKLKEYAIG